MQNFLIFNKKSEKIQEFEEKDNVTGLLHTRCI